MSTRDKAAEVLDSHILWPYGRCGCGVEFHRRGMYSADHRAHLADALADAGLLRDETAEQALARVEALAYSPQADTFRNEASRHVVEQPYADNRYVRLLDDLRAALRVDR